CLQHQGILPSCLVEAIGLDVTLGQNLVNPERFRMSRGEPVVSRLPQLQVYFLELIERVFISGLELRRRLERSRRSARITARSLREAEPVECFRILGLRSRVFLKGLASHLVSAPQVGVDAEIEAGGQQGWIQRNGLCELAGR